MTHRSLHCPLKHARLCAVLCAMTVALGACNEDPARTTFDADRTSGVRNETDLTPDPDLGEYVIDAAVLNGALWLVGENAGIVTIDLRTGQRNRLPIASTIGVERSGESIFLLAAAQPDPARAETFRVLAARAGATFEPLPPVGLAAKPLGFLANERNVFVLEPGALHVFSRGRSSWRKASLSAPCPGHVLAATKDETALYAGSDFGEWGGALSRIDLSTGTVTRIERRDSNDLCAGPLNLGCDPITGLITDIGPDCVIASIGLEHGMTTGRVLRICGTRVTPIFSRPRRDRLGDEEAFHALAPTPEGFVAFSWNAYYEFHSDGQTSRHSLRAFRSVGGVQVIETPHAVIVRGPGRGTLWTPLN